MHARTTLALTAQSLTLAAALFEGSASAQTRYAPARENEPRLRYGAALEGGGLFAPGVVDLGTLGLQGQIGVQFNRLVGFYAAPSLDIVSGHRTTGVQLGGALLVDFTLLHVFTVGVGPDIAGFTAAGGGEMAGGLLYGARLHLAVNPFVHIDRRGGRRQALTLGLDLRLATGGGATVLSTTPDPVLSGRRAASSEDLVASPTLTLGYQAF